GIRDATVTGVQTCALPIWKQGSYRTGVLRQQRKRFHVIRSRPLAEDVALRCGLDGRLQQRGVIEASVLLPGQIESRYGSRHGYGVRPVNRYLAQLAVGLEGRQLRRWAGAVEEQHFSLFGDIRQDEAIAAEPRLVLLHHAGHV